MGPGFGWKGLITAGRAEKELAECEVALVSSFFPLSPVHRLWAI